MNKTLQNYSRVTTSAIKAVAAKSPLTVSMTRVDTVDSIMKPLTRHIDDLENLIAVKEKLQDELFNENERLRGLIASNLQRITDAGKEIIRAREAQTKLRALLG